MGKNRVEWKCVKCGLTEFREKGVMFPGSAGFFNALETTAYICKECGHIELYAT